MSEYREFLASPVIRFVVGMSVCGVILTCWTFNGWVTLVALILGAFLYAVAEYTVHRYVLHEFPQLFPALYRGHLAHHEHPRDARHLFSPVQYDILVYLVYIPAAWLIFRQAGTVAAVVTGTLLFQLYYQWMHYVSHRPIVPATPWGKWMKKKHLLHHYKDEHAWYGVSNPAFDYMLGTNKVQERSVKPSNADDGTFTV